MVNLLNKDVSLVRDTQGCFQNQEYYTCSGLDIVVLFYYCIHFYCYNLIDSWVKGRFWVLLLNILLVSDKVWELEDIYSPPFSIFFASNLDQDLMLYTHLMSTFSTRNTMLIKVCISVSAKSLLESKTFVWY